jgi:TonB family protein
MAVPCPYVNDKAGMPYVNDKAWSCRTVVAFKISPAGQIWNVRIYQSSGNEIMDQAGIDAVLRSSPLPAIDSEAVDVQFSLDYNVAHSNNH